jgi:hypothetical protein
MHACHQAWIWSDCRNVSFGDRTSHTTWNSYCAPNLCNYRSSDGQIMSFEFDHVTFNTPLQEASIVLSVALDDHYTQAHASVSVAAARDAAARDVWICESGLLTSAWQPSLSILARIGCFERIHA